MNKIYKVIYSKVRNCYVVVSELAKNHSRGTKAEHTARKGSALTAALLLALSCVSVLGAPGAEAATKTKTDGSSFIGVERTDGTFEDSSYANFNGGGAHGVDAITIGKSAVAGNSTITIGDRNAAASIGSVYVGQGDTGNPKTDTGGWVTSVGFNSDATGYGSIAIGSNAKATNSNTNSGMELQKADGTPVSHPAIQGASTALGYSASAADGALAMGSNASATNLATALGYGASAADGNIAIGANSVATAAASTANAKFRETTDKDYAAPSSYVSVGSDTVIRRLTNVAAGSDANDAATVGQLSYVEKEAKAKGSWKLTAGGTNESTVEADSTVDFSAGSDGNLSVSKDKTSNNVTIGLNKELTGITSISNQTTSGTTTTGGKIELGTGGLTISGGDVNVSGSKITGLASGLSDGKYVDADDAQHAANLSDVNSMISTAFTNDKLKANVDASNIGTNITGSYEAQTANAVAWATALGTGKVASPNRKQPGYDQLVTGGTVWKELRQDLPTTNSIINMDFTTAMNLRNLDKLTVQYLVDKPSSKSGEMGSSYAEIDLKGYADPAIGGTNYGTAITNLRSALQDKEDNPLKDTDGNDITLTTATGDVLKHAVNLGDLQNAYNSLDTKVSGAHTALTVEGSKAAATEAGKYNGKNIQLHSDTDATTGKVTYDVKLANDLTGITSISGSTDANGARITLDTTDKNISVNGGSIKEVATNLDKDGNIIKGNENNAANMSDVKKMVDNAKSEAEGNDVDTHVKAGSYGVGTDHQVSMDIVDKNGKATGDKVTITDVAKASEMGDVTGLSDEVKNTNGKTTTVVDAINNVNTKVNKVDGKIGDQQYSKSNPSGSNKYVKDGDSITSAIGKLDGAVQQATSAAGKHSTVSAGSNITVHGETKSDGHTDYNVALNKDITVDSVTAKTTITDNLTVNNSATIGGVTIANKTISGLDDTKIEKGSTKAVNANTIYNELRPATDGNYIKITNTTAQNITSLDTQVKKNSDLVNSDGTTIKIGGKDSATKVDVSDKNGKGRVITGVVTDTNDASSAANVGYVNNMAAANTQQIYRDMNNAYGRLDNNINRAAAGSNALAALHPLEFDPDDKLSFAMGYGHYHNANAAAVGAFYQPDSKTQFNFGVALGNGDPGFNAGIAFKLGKPSPYAGMNRVTLIHTVQDLKASDEAKDKRIDALEKENQEMKKQLQAIMAKLNG